MEDEELSMDDNGEGKEGVKEDKHSSDDNASEDE
jgi:hypothetical protein